MNGKVTTHNVRQYAPKGNPPEFNYDVDFSREKLNVWAGLCGNGLLLGPFFFENNMNGNGYLQILNEHMIPELMENFPMQQRGCVQTPMVGTGWRTSPSTSCSKKQIG